MIWPVTNARVAAAVFLNSATIKVPASMAADTHLRDAVSKERRHGVEQKRCGLLPVVRGSKMDSNQRQFTGTPFTKGKPSPASSSGQLMERHNEKNGQTGDG